MKSLPLICALFGCSIAAAQDPWPPNGPYLPKHVYAALSDAIHEQLEVPVDGTPPYWFSVSTVGYPFDPNTDEGKIGLNALANFMPPADGRLSTGEKKGLLVDLDRRLDRWYKYLLDNIAFTYDVKTPEVLAAEKRLYKTDPVTGAIIEDEEGVALMQPGYRRYKNAYYNFLYWDKTKNAKEIELSSKEKANAEIEYIKALDDYEEAKRNGIGQAVGTLSQFWNSDGASQNVDRLNDLKTFRGLNKLEPGITAPPLSYLIPPAKSWGDGSGWRSASFSNKNTFNHYERHVERISGGGGINLGFVTIGGRGGKTEVRQSSINQIRSFSYAFKLKRILIYRPWFDASLLENHGWTWKEKTNGSFPLVARPSTPSGAPSASADAFKVQSIGLALVPVQLVIAKDLEVRATFSKAEWDQAKTSAGGEGGAMLFGCIAFGGSKDTSTFTETTKGNDVEVVAKQPDITIIGAISRIVPVSPTPSKDAGKWPESAWKPWE